MKKENDNGNLFWADQLAKQIIERKKFKYSDKKIPMFKEYTVKTSASLSGVLHIGRLSDTIRGEIAYTALKGAGVKAKIIWVAEDMDSLRKIPKGVPADFEKYIGVPVTDIPDPDGNYKSYADKHREEYLRVIDEFVFTKMEKFSMREEYKKGNFKVQIKKIMKSMDDVKKILNKHRTHKLDKYWSPWTPICENCGKIVTPDIHKIEDGIITYKCKDYQFEKTKAKGCNFKGTADPLKDDGKLMWKSEWAAQWDKWKIVAEGAGKEYQVPNSAFWVNAEIVEKVLGFPMPQPIFYEHIMIDGVKMSASLGNVVYPKDWLEVASPELLRLFYNKRLMKTRSFSWKDLPNLYDEDDRYTRIYKGIVKLENSKEEWHIKRLYKLSHGMRTAKPIDMSFSYAILVAQIFPEKKDIIKGLKATGHFQKEYEKEIFERIEKAKGWLKKYALEDQKFEIQSEINKNIKLSQKQKKALHEVADALEKKEFNEKSLFEEFYEICKKSDLKPADFFKAGYLVLLNKEKGPKLANFLLTLGKEKIIDMFRQA